MTVVGVTLTASTHHLGLWVRFSSKAGEDSSTRACNGHAGSLIVCSRIPLTSASWTWLRSHSFPRIAWRAQACALYRLETAARFVLEYGSGYGLKQRSLGIPRLAPCSQHISARTRRIACPPARTRFDLGGFWAFSLSRSSRGGPWTV